jgi:6-phosphogluconolactonase
MKLANKGLLLVLAVLAALSLSGCAGKGCPNLSLGSGTGSGGTTGGVSKGSQCTAGGTGGIGAGGASALVFEMPTSSSLGVLGLQSSGSLAVISPFTSPTLTGSGADDMLIVNGKFLYIPQSANKIVEGFAINRTTAGLTPIPGTPVDLTSIGADTIATDPKGRFLFVGVEGGSGIAAFRIDQTTGALTPSAPPFSTPGLFSADVFTVDGSGKFLYVGEQDTTVHGFMIDQTTGALTTMVGSPFNLGIATPHADSTGKFLLGVAGFADEGTATDAHIHVFAIDPTTGVPAEIAGSPFATTTPPLDFAISPNGKFVYTFGTTSGSTSAAIEGFQIDATTGALTALSGSPFTTLPGAGQCKFGQSGGTMICSSAYGSSTFSVFATNSTTGAITHTGTDLSTVGTLPFAVTE